ncbi:ABC transporter substrate-binding protein, partial [Escherichia coli]|uniref:ABC transporter substrate-binding protein n=1 Tax=Escherichia coli TaxID=562 RepID=UPI001C6CACA1
SMLATSTPAGSNDAYRYDPAAANKLLDEAGWKMGKDGYRYKDGQKLSLLHSGIPGYWKDIMEAVQGDMKKVGADLRVQLF